MALKPLRQVLDGNRHGMTGIEGQGFVDYRVLAADTPEVHTVPTGAKYVLFKATGNFYANFGAAGAVPAADVTDGSGSLLNPELRSIDGAATIGLEAPATCIVCLEFFK